MRKQAADGVLATMALNELEFSQLRASYGGEEVLVIRWDRTGSLKVGLTHRRRLKR